MVESGRGGAPRRRFGGVRGRADSARSGGPGVRALPGRAAGRGSGTRPLLRGAMRCSFSTPIRRPCRIAFSSSSAAVSTGAPPPGPSASPTPAAGAPCAGRPGGRTRARDCCGCPSATRASSAPARRTPRPAAFATCRSATTSISFAGCDAVGPFALLPEAVVTSARHYRSRGALRQTFRVWTTLAGYFLGVSRTTSRAGLAGAERLTNCPKRRGRRRSVALPRPDR